MDCQRRSSRSMMAQARMLMMGSSAATAALRHEREVAGRGVLQGVAQVAPFTGERLNPLAGPKVVDGNVWLNATLDVSPDSVEAIEIVKDLRTSLDAADPYFLALNSGRFSGRQVLGLRYNADARVALKLEWNRTRERGLGTPPDELRLQYAIGF